MARSKAANITSWVLQVLLAAGFILAAIPKLTGNPKVIEGFHSFGYPDWFRILIGVLEALGAIGLLIPRLTRLAAAGLVCIMIGVFYTLIAAHQAKQLPVPALYSILLIAVIALRSGEASRARSAAL